jgi:hypothetical protein
LPYFAACFKKVTWPECKRSNEPVTNTVFIVLILI